MPFFQSIRIWYVAQQPDSRRISEWYFFATAIRSVSQAKKDPRAIFLYVYENAEDFCVFFPSETHKQRLVLVLVHPRNCSLLGWVYQ